MASGIGTQRNLRDRGHQHTDYREGGFFWSGDNRRGGVFDIAITDEATSLRFFSDEETEAPVKHE